MTESCGCACQQADTPGDKPVYASGMNCACEVRGVPSFEPHTSLVLSKLYDAGLRGPVLAETVVSSRQDEHEVKQRLLDGYPLEHHDIIIDGPAGPMSVAIFRLAGDQRTDGPAFFSIHGGGLIKGCRFNDVEAMVPALERFGGIIISPEYRLAPEHPTPAAVEDCWAALKATRAMSDLGWDGQRFVVRGISAGGCLAAGVALKARDTGEVSIDGVMLNYPMLDDRNSTPSARQYESAGSWTTADSRVAWSLALGEREGSLDLSAYEVPARAEDLAGLPPVFIDVAACEPFRDESVAWAQRIWCDGGDAELHVYPGGTHCMEVYGIATWIGPSVEAVRLEWFSRLVEPTPAQASVDELIRANRFPGLENA